MTELIARIAGPYLLLTAVGFVVSRGFYSRMILSNEKADPILLNLSGAAHFIVGMLVLVNHFRFGSIAESVVTLVGIAAALKGAALITVPELTLRSPKTVGGALTGSTAGFGLVGLYLSFVGYWPVAASAN